MKRGYIMGIVSGILLVLLLTACRRDYFKHNTLDREMIINVVNRTDEAVNIYSMNTLDKDTLSMAMFERWTSPAYCGAGDTVSCYADRETLEDKGGTFQIAVIRRSEIDSLGMDAIIERNLTDTVYVFNYSGAKATAHVNILP